MTNSFERGDGVLYIRTERVSVLGQPAQERVSVTVAVVTSVTRDGQIKAFHRGGSDTAVKLHRHSLEHGMTAYRLPKAQWDVGAVLAYCAARPWPHAPQHLGAPFDGLDQARAELRQFRVEASV